LATVPDDGTAFQSPRRLRPFRLLPGGEQAVPTEFYAGSIVAASLLLLILIRRNLSNEASHVHVGGAAAITFLLYYLIVQALIRVVTGNLAERYPNSPVTEAVAFFA
jgi:hypothetical protein